MLYIFTKIITSTKIINGLLDFTEIVIAIYIFLLLSLLSFYTESNEEKSTKHLLSFRYVMQINVIQKLNRNYNYSDKSTDAIGEYISDVLVYPNYHNVSQILIYESKNLLVKNI